MLYIFPVNKVSNATEKDEEVDVIVNGNEKVLNLTQQVLNKNQYYR